LRPNKSVHGAVTGGFEAARSGPELTPGFPQWRRQIGWRLITEASMSRSIKKVTTGGPTKQSPKALPKAKASPSGAAKQAKSKHDLILSLLERKQGASLAEMQAAAGWQAHSVRGFLSGTVKKRLGLKLDSARSKDGELRYTIAT
jgi:hypothetical protein